jgi:NADH:ubiquinone oxidoreductase subunit E
MEATRLDALIDKYRAEQGAVIALLQDVQEEQNYLPRKALEHIARRLDVPLIQLYGLATFYKAFTLKPKGEHTVTCCMGTACHVRGGQRIVEGFERELGIKAGDTTDDLMFTLETVNCVGACAVGPLVIIDGEYHGLVTTAKVKGLLKPYRGTGGGGQHEES